MPKKILFVCTGNTCRSPLAEGLMNKLAHEMGLLIEARSAGLAAFSGVPATPEAVEAAREVGVDLSRHESQPLSKTLVTESDFILTMTERHMETILKKMPALEGKVFLVSSFAGEPAEDVDDPVGRPIESYRKVVRQLDAYLRKSIKRLSE